MKYTHTVWLFDGTFINVDESNYPQGIADVESAMIAKTPVYVGDSLLNGSYISRIEKFGNKNDFGPHLAIQGDFESAAKLLPQREDIPLVREKIKQEIREKLSKVDPMQISKDEYIAAVRLQREEDKRQKGA